MPETNITEDILGELALLVGPALGTKLAKLGGMVRMGKGEKVGLKLAKLSEEERFVLDQAIKSGKASPIAQGVIDDIVASGTPLTDPRAAMAPGLEQIRKNAELLSRSGVDTTDLNQFLRARGVEPTQLKSSVNQPKSSMPRLEPASELERTELANQALGMSQESVRRQMKPVDI